MDMAIGRNLKKTQKVKITFEGWIQRYVASVKQSDLQLVFIFQKESFFYLKRRIRSYLSPRKGFFWVYVFVFVI